MRIVKLGDLPIKWMRGAGLRKSDVSDIGKYECILYGELFTKYRSVVIDKGLLSRTNATCGVMSNSGDVLVPGTSTAAKSEMIRARAVQANGIFIGGDINIIRPQNGLFDAKYLAYFFETTDAKRQLDRYITGTTGIIHISNSGIKNLEVPLVPIEVQRRVVKWLDAAFERINRAIELTEKNIQNARDFRAQVIDDEINKSVGDNTTLGDFCSFENGDRGKNYPSKSKQTKTGVPFINAGNLNRSAIDFSNMAYISNETFEKLGAGKVRPNDILFCLRGSLGKFGSVGELQKGAIASSLVIVRPDLTRAMPEYLLYYFESSETRRMIEKYENGAAQPNLSAGNVKKFEINLPEITAQESIIRLLGEKTKSADTLISLYGTKKQHLAYLKQSLLTQAFFRSKVE